MRCDAVIACQIGNDAINKRVAPDFPKDRRAMSPEFLGDDINAQSSHTPAGNLATFIKIDVGVGALHCSFLVSDNPLVSFTSRASSLNPPRPSANLDATVSL